MSDINATTINQGITWERLIELEPPLGKLLYLVKAARPHKLRRSQIPLESLWGQFKDQIASLVGFHRRGNCDAILKTSEAYEVVYHKLWHALHDANRNSKGGAR